MSASLHRTVVGRIAAHAGVPVLYVSTAFATSDWGPTTNISIAVSTSTGSLTLTGPVVRNVRYQRVGVLADCYVQSVQTSSGSGGTIAGVAARINALAIPTNAIALQSPIARTDTEQLVERSAGSIVQADATLSVNRTGPMRYGLDVRGTEARGRTFVTPAVDRTLSGLALVAAGNPGVFHDGFNQFTVVSEFYVMKDRYLTVRGPSGTGWRARLKNAGGTVVAEATESAGVAVVDCFGVLFPAVTRIEIDDPATATVYVAVDPRSRVWGGDEWVFNANPSTGGSVVQTAVGKLVSHEAVPVAGISTAFNTADWTGSGNLTISVQGSGNLRIVQATAAQSRAAWYTALSDRADVFQQFVRTASATLQRFGLLARSATNVPLPSAMIFSRRGTTASGTATDREAQLTEFVASATVQTSVAGSQFPALPDRISMAAVGTVAKMNGFSTPTFRALSGIGLTTAGRLGFLTSHDTVSGSQTFEASAYYAMTSHLVRVEGDSGDNWIAYLLDSSGNEIAEATPVAGVALLDCIDWMIAMPEVHGLRVVETSTGNVLGDFSASVGRVWGGDVFVFTGDGGYPASRLAHRKAGAQRLLLKR